MSSRSLLSTVEKTPGPGHYHTSSTANLKNAPKVKFGSANRSINHQNDSPEPSRYNPDPL